MGTADSKIVHKAMLRARPLCRQIIETDNALQELKADWQGGGGHDAYVRWVAAQGSNLDGALINATSETKLNTVINQHHTLRLAIQAELDALKGVE